MGSHPAQPYVVLLLDNIGTVTLSKMTILYLVNIENVIVNLMLGKNIEIIAKLRISRN